MGIEKRTAVSVRTMIISKVLPVELVDTEFIMEEISSNAVELIMIFTEIMNNEVANANVTLRFETIQPPLMWFSTRLSSRMNFSNSLGSNVRRAVTSERKLPHLETLAANDRSMRQATEPPDPISYNKTYRNKVSLTH